MESRPKKETGSCFRACCCCEPRTGALWIGVINLVAGTVGITWLYFVINLVINETDSLREKPGPISSETEHRLDVLAEYFWSLLLVYVFPTVVSWFVGLTVIFASAKENELLLHISIFMNGILILASFAISILMFVLGVHWFLLIPVFIWGFVQIYFSWGLMNYRSTNLKTATTSQTV